MLALSALLVPAALLPLAPLVVLGAPQFTDSNLEQFPTIVDPTRSSLFPNPTLTIPRPPGEGPFPSSTASVTFPVEPPVTPTSESLSTGTTTTTDDSVTVSTTPATQSLPTNPSAPTTPLPDPTDAAYGVRVQGSALAAVVAGLLAALV